MATILRPSPKLQHLRACDCVVLRSPLGAHPKRQYIPVALISLDERITIEGFPGKTFDYLSMNKVLLSISNKDSAVAKFIERHSLGVNIEPNSVKSFLDAFEKLSSRQFLSETLLNVRNVNKNQIKKSEIVKQYLTLI